MLERAARLRRILPLRGDLSDVEWGEKIGAAMFGQIIPHLSRDLDLEGANKVAAVYMVALRPLLPPAEAAAFDAFKLANPDYPALVEWNPKGRGVTLDEVEKLALALHKAGIKANIRPITDMRVVGEPDDDVQH